MAKSTFSRPDFDAFCMLRDSGVTIIGQHITAEQAALECRMVDQDQFCRRCGAEARGKSTAENSHGSTVDALATWSPEDSKEFANKLIWGYGTAAFGE